ncbi:hypothetical protein PRK78_007223 [Emydomyces testavorans]|uniref:Protein kinase domain-containing protein n=1 Tax=Emydomyces testavorans TaxID=2070801 RepID=A0AAF0DNX4_9EURO|nr:hypothetical protein PRK78_007223 [Emydomyces testavorans]
MPPHRLRRGRHPLALFSLRPLNDAAVAVLAHPANIHLVSILRNGQTVLDIGFNTRSKYPRALATLGSGDADILVKGPGIAPVQCSFEIKWSTGVIMLRDSSIDHSTQVFGPDAMPFQNGRPRRVLVIKGLNSMLGMGSERHGAVRFELIWHDDAEQTMAKTRALRPKDKSQLNHNRLAGVSNNASSPHPLGGALASRLGRRAQKIRHFKLKSIGSGAFGEVFKAIDVDTGRLMAVKRFKSQHTRTFAERQRRDQEYKLLQREVQALERIRHPHIINYLGSTGWGGEEIEIFMGLKQGNVEALAETPQVNPFKLTKKLVPQILQALDYLAYHKVVHRDVKAQNILYTIREKGRYCFQLADFGLANRMECAKTTFGTIVYMAPEMLTGQLQTDKVDVWAFFVTLMWVLNVDGFRIQEPLLNTSPQAHALVQSAKRNSLLSDYREMAAFDPLLRASAAQMLVKLYRGKGLTTPAHKVLPMNGHFHRR